MIKHNLKTFKFLCQRTPEYIAQVYKMTEYKAGKQRYWYKNNGSNILGIAHTDCVSKENHFKPVIIPSETIVYSPSLDDRAGVYVMLYIMPLLGINIDVLLTEGEEMGNSTGQDFVDDFKGKVDYNWMFQFDRGYDEPALYDYIDNPNWKRVIKEIWGRPDSGLFSDITFMEELGICGINVPTGYKDYHSVRAHIVMSELDANLEKFMKFHYNYKNVKFHHKIPKYAWSKRSNYGYYGYSHGGYPMSDYGYGSFTKYGTRTRDEYEWERSYKPGPLHKLYDCANCGLPTMEEDFVIGDSIDNYIIDNGICQDCFYLYYKDVMPWIVSEEEASEEAEKVARKDIKTNKEIIYD